MLVGRILFRLYRGRELELSIDAVAPGGGKQVTLQWPIYSLKIFF